MRYTFHLLNHLGEPHDAHAIACGRELLHHGYRVEIVQEDRLVKVIKPPIVILDDLIRHLLRGRR